MFGEFLFVEFVFLRCMFVILWVWLVEMLFGECDDIGRWFVGFYVDYLKVYFEWWIVIDDCIVILICNMLVM